MPRALITGITGQDGSYLTELLLGQGYEVHGALRRDYALEQARIDELTRTAAALGGRLFLHCADLDDAPALRRVFTEVGPDEVYHLAGQTHVGLSLVMPETTGELTGMGTLRLLEIVRLLPRPARFFHAASSEIFGRPAAWPQDESTPIAPVNPYGCAKAFATQLVSVYRSSFGLFACNGILYNHESPRRGEHFVTQKICRGAAAIKLGRQRELVLGDTAAERDWGHARDYVRAMWLMLQRPEPTDYVIATGRMHRVQDILEIAFTALELDWRRYVRQDPRLLRSSESMRLVGNPARARRELGWEPQTSFAQMIREMTEAAVAQLQR
jgi:GDPmannose 4,6-dehydratase